MSSRVNKTTQIPISRCIYSIFLEFGQLSFSQVTPQSLTKTYFTLHHVSLSRDFDPISFFVVVINLWPAYFSIWYHVIFHFIELRQLKIIFKREEERDWRRKKFEAIKVNNKNVWIAREIKNEWSFFPFHTNVQYNNQKVHKCKRNTSFFFLKKKLVFSQFDTPFCQRLQQVVTIHMNWCDKKFKMKDFNNLIGTQINPRSLKLRINVIHWIRNQIQTQDSRVRLRSNTISY